MKTPKIFLLLGCMCLLVAGACSKDSAETGTIYGEADYDGRPIKFNTAEVLEVHLPAGLPASSMKGLLLANVRQKNIICGFHILGINPASDFEYEIDRYSNIRFQINDRSYQTKMLPGDPAAGDNVFAIKSLGIDPSTGREYVIGRDTASEESLSITGGEIKWTLDSSKGSGRLVFELRLEDGKKVKGHGDVPLNVL